jgi:hypothetical protein
MTPNHLYFCANGTEAAGLGVDWSVLGMVLLGVAALMFIIRGIGLAAAASHPDASGSKNVASVGKGPTASASTVSSADVVAPEIVAILTAAASVALGAPVRVLGVREVYHGNVLDQRAWGREGRREIYLSHRIR